jgi:hypothetical protein
MEVKDISDAKKEHIHNIHTHILLLAVELSSVFDQQMC